MQLAAHHMDGSAGTVLCARQERTNRAACSVGNGQTWSHLMASPAKLFSCALIIIFLSVTSFSHPVFSHHRPTNLILICPSLVITLDKEVFLPLVSHLRPNSISPSVIHNYPQISPFPQSVKQNCPKTGSISLSINHNHLGASFLSSFIC